MSCRVVSYQEGGHDDKHMLLQPYRVHRIHFGSVGRVVLIPTIQCRPMCIAIWTKEEEAFQTTNFLLSGNLSSQVITIVYTVPKDHPNYYDFPINYLRNICIRNIESSHFVFLDLDMWPTRRADGCQDDDREDA